MLDLMTTTHGSYLDIWKKRWTRNLDMAEYPRPFLWKRMDQESGYGQIPKTIFVEMDGQGVSRWNTQDRFCGN